MKLNKLTLTNFRNYETQQIEFIDGINLFVGNNAQGKTNIIEAIYIMAFGKSYRTIKDEEIVKFNSNYSKIIIDYEKNYINNEVEYKINELNRKSILKNGVRVKKISDYVGEIPIVIFSPDSLDIVKGSPAKRREFINMISSQISKSYILYHFEYMKCLKLKNNALKKDYVDREYIKVLNEKMSVYIEKIVDFRSRIINKILEKATLIEKELTNFKEEINLKYDTDFLGLKSEEIKNVLDKYLDIEIIKKTSLKGIQKDDLIIYINDVEVSKYGSQGQNRTALLALKLADFEVLKEVKKENPILLLDDIMSELDKNRISYMLKYIENYQSIITSTDSSFAKDVQNIKISKVFNGTLEI